MQVQKNEIEAVLKDFIEKVISKIYPSWLKIGAHTIAYGYPEQCLFWHTVNASMLACKVVEYFQKQGREDFVDLRELISSLMLHDLDRVSQGKFGRTISLQEVQDAFINFGIADFCQTLTPEMAQTLINNTHLFKHSHSFKTFLGDERFHTLLLFTGLLDALAVIQTPRGVWKTKGEQERSVYELLKTTITAGKYEFLYHQADLVSGATTNALHHAVSEALSEEIPELGQLAFFPNGVCPSGSAA